MINLKKIIILTTYIFFTSTLFAFEFKNLVEENFSNRKLDFIEGIWEKTVANQGATGCITMFYKVEENLYNQIHIDSCFVLGKVTGKQKKIKSDYYEGENAIYYLDGNSSWAPSSIKISENLNTFSITHGSYGNTFLEQWKRIWPQNINEYNKSQNNQ